MAELELVPVKTRILTDKDDIVDVIEEYAKDIGADYYSKDAKSAVEIAKLNLICKLAVVVNLFLIDG